MSLVATVMETVNAFPISAQQTMYVDLAVEIPLLLMPVNATLATNVLVDSVTHLHTLAQTLALSNKELDLITQDANAQTTLIALLAIVIL